jgi:DNA polymerase-3 subunit delta
MITSLTGMNSFMVQYELNTRVNRFMRENGPMAVEKIDCEEAAYEDIVANLRALPLLAPAKLIILRRPSAHKKFADELADLCATTPDTTEVIIIESKTDKRSSYYKNLKRLTDLREFSSLSADQLADWLVYEARRRGGSLRRGDARYLVERLGDNQQLLSSELDKLLAYNSHVTRASIDSLTEQSPQGNIFQMLDAAFAGDAQNALRLYGELRAQNVEPLMVLAMLARQLHLLALIKAAGGRDWRQVAEEAELNVFAVRKTAGLAQRLTLPTIKRLVSELHDLDVKIKNSSINPDEAIKFCLVKLAH